MIDKFCYITYFAFESFLFIVICDVMADSVFNY